MSSLQSTLTKKQELVVTLKKKIENAKQMGKLRIMEDLRSELADVTRHVLSLRKDIANAKGDQDDKEKKRLANVGK